MFGIKNFASAAKGLLGGSLLVGGAGATLALKDEETAIKYGRVANNVFDSARAAFPELERSRGADGVVIFRGDQRSQPALKSMVAQIKGLGPQKSNIERLELIGLNLDDAQIGELLSNIQSIKAIEVRNCPNVTGEFLSRLPDQVDPVSVTLGKLGGFNIANLKHLDRFFMRAMSLDGIPLTNNHLAILKDLNFAHLYFNEAKVTPKEVASELADKNIRMLQIRTTENLPDAAVDEGIDAVKRLFPPGCVVMFQIGDKSAQIFTDGHKNPPTPNLASRNSGS